MTTQELQGRMRIILETVHLLLTTKNNSILNHRYQLLVEHIPAIAEYENASGYSEAVNQAKEDYKRMYYDRELNDVQIAAITAPTKFPLSHFYLKSICGCLSRFITEKKAEISTMKQEKAKIKRAEEIKSAIAWAKNELQINCSNAPQYTEGLAAIENAETEVMV